ncbi:MAG: DUF5667 domain-containing protein [Candidatus Daviesbacteria bacterium]|nr:DUF5667 domain-containing protein [Candidatus Daviesbacteria bacterium]
MKTALILTLLSFLFTFSGPVLALTAPATSSAIIDPGKLEVGEALISPASSLYFLKALRERIELFMSADSQVRAQRELEFAVRRLREVNTLIEKNRQDLIEETLQRYKDAIWQARDLAADNSTDESFQEGIGESVARHLYVLQTLYNQTNNLNAKRAVRASVQEIMDYENGLIKGIKDPALKQELITRVGLRMQAGCQFLEEQVNSSDLNQTQQAILQEYVTNCQKDSLKFGTIPNK